MPATIWSSWTGTGPSCSTRREDVEWAIELLELGNLQLLRYQLLDRALDGRLYRVTRLVEEVRADMRALFKASEMRQALRELMRLRSTSIAEFQDVDRDIKLIGDRVHVQPGPILQEHSRIARAGGDFVEEVAGQYLRRQDGSALPRARDPYSLCSRRFGASSDEMSKPCPG
jgi:hypothetical protein